MAGSRIVIVGGGILGSMHALMADQLGYDVRWLDRDPVPSGASVRNFGLCWVSGRRAGPELSLALRARELWEKIGRDVPAVGFRGNGSLTVAVRDDETRVLERAVSLRDATERGFALLSPDDARNLNPGLTGRVAAALHCARDAAVEPRLAIAAIRAHLLGHDNVTFIAPREVVDVQEHGVVDHTGERHDGDLVVLCVGAVSDGTLAAHFPGGDLQAVRLHMAETAPLGRPLTTSIADGNSLRYYPAFKGLADELLSPQNPALATFGIQLLCQQRLHGGLTIGDTHEYEEPFPFDMQDEPLDLVVDLARRIVGEPFPPIVRRWTGTYHQLRTVTDDQLYFRQEIAPGVVAVTGAGGRGMTLSPAIAEETFA